jgi:hypothetical protein
MELIMDLTIVLVKNTMFLFVGSVIMVKQRWWMNENQQNLLHSDRIGSGIEEKTQSIRDSYQGIKEIS